MKYLKFWLILTNAIFLFPIVSLTQESDQEAFEKMILLESKGHRNTIQARNFLNTNTANYDLKYHRMEWEVDPAVHYIKGAITSYFIPSTSDFNKIFFELHTGLAVDSVKYHSTSMTFSQHSGTLLEINLPAVLPLGILDSVSVYYQGTPPTNSEDAYETKIVCQGNGDYNAMWTLSEPYGAQEWWPCKQDLNDKIDSIDVIISTPSQYYAVSNGLLISETVEGSNTLFHWKHQYPIPTYLIAIAITEYDVYSDNLSLNGGGQLLMENYLYPCQSATAATINTTTENVMNVFIDLFGDYPYPTEKYGHAQFGWGGGMEHTTVSFMGSFSHLLIAHELGPNT